LPARYKPEVVDLAILDGAVYCSDLGLTRCGRRHQTPEWPAQPGGSEAGSDTSGAWLRSETSARSPDSLAPIA
jgi:hypothetical protein